MNDKQQLKDRIDFMLSKLADIKSVFGTITDSAVLLRLDRDGYDFSNCCVNGDWPDLYRFVIDNGLLNPTHEVFSRISGYDVAVFLEILYQLQSKAIAFKIEAQDANFQQILADHWQNENAKQQIREALTRAKLPPENQEWTANALNESYLIYKENSNASI